MRKTYGLLLLSIGCALSAIANNSHAAILPGTAFWSFQSTPAGTGAGNAFTQAVTVESFAGTPTFARAGNAFRTDLGGGASSFVLGGVTYSGDPGNTNGSNPGNVAAWDQNSKDNSFSVTLDTTGFQDLQIRLDYRNNSTSNGVSSFSYRVGVNSAVNVIVPTMPRVNNGSNAAIFSAWSTSLTNVTAINDRPSITLTWNLLDVPDQTSFRLDNLLITSSPIPEPMAVVAGLLGASSLLRRRHSSQF